MINKNDVDARICAKGLCGELTIEEINNLPREYDELKPSFKEWYYFMNHERPNPTKKETLKRKIHLVSTLTSLASDSERIKEAERKVFISFPKEKPTIWDSFKNKIKRIVKWFVAIRIVKKL
jgi:hypothetical protein